MRAEALGVVAGREASIGLGSRWRGYSERGLQGGGESAECGRAYPAPEAEVMRSVICVLLVLSALVGGYCLLMCSVICMVRVLLVRKMYNTSKNDEESTDACEGGETDRITH